MATLIGAPTLVFLHSAWMKLLGFLTLSEKEISGFGRVRVESGRLPVVDEIYLLPQTVSSAHTMIDPEDVSIFITSLIESGEDPSLIRLWWHSHADMKTFWSETDNENMWELIGGSPYMFGLVGNREGDVKIRLDLASPRITIDDLSMLVDYVSPEVARWCKDQIEAMVSVAPEIVPNTELQLVEVVSDNGTVWRNRRSTKKRRS